MHAYLLVGNNNSQQKKVLEELSHAQRLNYSLQKIADVQNLHKLTKLSLKSKTAIVVNDFQLATEAAQNAFLKELEEPQKNIVYFLLATNTSNILPTIQSRCRIIEIGEEAVTDKDTEFFEDFFHKELADKLTEIYKIRTRDQARSFLTKIIRGGSAKMTSSQGVPHTLKYALKALEAIEQNGNTQLQLTNFVVNI